MPNTSACPVHDTQRHLVARAAKARAAAEMAEARARALRRIADEAASAVEGHSQ